MGRLDPTTELLYSPYDREVADPIRKRIRYRWQFERFIKNTNGIKDCFSSIFDADLTIDKIFLDFDSPSGISGCLEEARTLYDWLRDNDYQVIVTLTGKKGFHFYILLKPTPFSDESKNQLTNATYYILSQAFGYNDTNGLDSIKCETVDPHIIGDVRRIGRIPNTLRPPKNLTYCTYLPEDWIEMNVGDLVMHMKTTHSYDYDINNSLMTLEEFPEAPVKKTLWSDDDIVSPLSFNGEIRGNAFLQNVLRPCLYRHIVSHNPPHYVRLAVTADLLQHFDIDTIIRVYSTLNWADWDPEVTRSKVEEIKMKQKAGKFDPFSCTRLRELKIPQLCCVY